MWFGMVVMSCVREQTRNHASLAQAGPPRLSESCRVSRWVLVRGSRLGDQQKGLSDMVSRSGERHSPKRGREETWEF